jgi:tape measure domain-containing protein
VATQFAVDLVFKSRGTDKLKGLTGSTQKLDQAARKAQGGLNGASNNVRKFGRSAQGAKGSVDGLKGSMVALKSAVAALGIGLIVKGFVDIAGAAIKASGDIAKMEASFASLTGSTQAAKDLREELYKLGLETPFEDQELLNSGRRFLAVGVDVEKLGGTINRVGELAVQSGQSLDRLGLIYAQIYAKGRLQGEENLQLLEAGVNLNKELAQVTGKSGAALQEAMSKGQVSIEQVNEAIVLATGEMRGLDEASKTAAIQLQNIGTSFSLLGTEFSKALEPAFRAVFGVINAGFEAVFPSLDALEAAFAPILTEAERFAELLEGNPELVNAIATVMDSLLQQALYPMVDAAKNFNDWLDQNPQGVINVVLDIELAIRQAVATAQVLVSILDAAAKLASAINPVAQIGNIKGGFDALGRGDAKGALDSFGKISGGSIPGILDDVAAAMTKLGEIPQMQRLPVTPYGGSASSGRAGDLDNGRVGTDGTGGGAGGGKKGRAGAKPKTDDLAKLQAELKLLQDQAAIQDKINAAELAGDQLLVMRLEGEQERLNILSRGEEAIRKMNTAEGKALQGQILNQKLTDQKVKQEQELAQLAQDSLKPLQDEIELLQARLDGTEDVLKAEREIARLKAAGVSGSEATALVESRNQLEKQVEAQDKARASAEQLAGSIASSLTGSLRGLIDGSMSAEEALSNAFQGIADAFLDMAMQMIQEWLKMQMIEILTSGAGGGLFGGGFKMFAEGGYVTGPTKAVVGEGGEPEYVIPESKMADAMQRYAGGATGDNVVNGPSSSGGGGAAVAEAPTPITINGGITQFGGNDYIRKEELPKIIEQSSKLGEARTLRRLQMNPGSRRRIGL